MSEVCQSTATLICLTGGMATGKSQVAEWFETKSWVVICTDKIAHRLYEPDQDLPRQIAREFGNDVVSAEGRVDRQKLGEIVFCDPLALKRLNALVHPKVRSEWKSRAAETVRSGRRTLVIIPLAYETDAVQEFQQTWVVACSRDEQIARLRQRGLNPVQIEKRLSSQWPLQKKIDRADLVIWNNGSWSLTEEQLKLL